MGYHYKIHVVDETPRKMRLPLIRAECEVGGPRYQRPCPYLRCKYHIASTTTISGRLRIFDGWLNVKHSCALDVADEGSHRLDEIGKLMGLSRERIRQIIEEALRKLKRRI